MRSRHPPHPEPPASDDAAQAKHLLRQRLRFRRRMHVAAQDDLIRHMAFAVLPDLLVNQLGGARAIALYAAVGAEPSLARIAPALRSIGHRIALPWAADRLDAPMFRAWDDSAMLEAGPFGTPQPPATAAMLAPDVIFCPLLGFDRRGGRLGQGGGWYDRVIASAIAAGSRPWLVGVGWAVQEIDAVPTAAHDQPMDAIWTEEAVIMIPATDHQRARDGRDG